MADYGYCGVITNVLICTFLIVGCVSGNTQDICNRDPDYTAASKTPGDNGFRIKIAGTPQPDRYTPGHVYTISINGTYPNQQLLGFMLVAVPLNAQDESTTMGTFQHLNSGVTKFADACYWVVQHTYIHEKAGVEVLWTAPPEGSGCVEFRATVIEHRDIWYKDDGALTRVFCEDTGVSDSAIRPSLMPQCCACGAAKYEVTFHGLWSRQTHPTNYPEHKALLHWSNIVGASHNKNYMPWQYGDYASAGVKEVCEFGYPRKMEEEMRQHSQDVRTVIKTPGIWWKEGKGLQQTRWARFSVDKKKHLMSLLTMIGPSPDWCVGVSALNLCLPNCTWSGDQFIDLYPWDAGTDDGLAYMSANLKSDPAQKIHRITNTFPNNPASPFFGDQPIRPLARLELKRLHPKPGATVVCTGNEEDSHEDEGLGGGFGGGGDDEGLSDMEKKKLMLMQTGKCAMSDWQDWTECSVTCGVGKKVRKRMYHNPMVDEDMCGSPTMEAENCIGIENECGDVMPGCEATQWSDWSPCSVTCGQGVQDRRRYYLNKELAAMKCDRTMDEQQACIADFPDCMKANMMKNFTALCSQPMLTGSCRGRFQRWYYDPIMEKCLPFDYSGCRGNENQFRSQEECLQMCVHRLFDVGPGGGDLQQPQVGEVISEEEMKRRMMVEQQRIEKQQIMERQRLEEEEAMRKKQMLAVAEPIDCMMTPWTAWSTCSATCGRSFKNRQRMVKRQAENGGKRCPKRLQKKKKCDVPRCGEYWINWAPLADQTYSVAVAQESKKNTKINCVATDWSIWSPCSATCGHNAYQYSRRIVLTDSENGGRHCPTKLEKKRRCDLEPCAVDCTLGPWSEWTPCLHTCLQERTRQVLNKPKNGGAQCGAKLSRRDCDEEPCQKHATGNTADAEKRRKNARRRRRRRH